MLATGSKSAQKSHSRGHFPARWQPFLARPSFPLRLPGSHPWRGFSGSDREQRSQPAGAGDGLKTPVISWFEQMAEALVAAALGPLGPVAVPLIRHWRSRLFPCARRLSRGWDRWDRWDRAFRQGEGKNCAGGWWEPGREGGGKAAWEAIRLIWLKVDI